MKRLSDYLRSALYNIRHNKAYAAFCILGTALTFVFVIILLQLAHTITSTDAPLGNADRTIELSADFTDKSGENVGEIDLPMAVQLKKMIEGSEAFGIFHAEPIVIKAGNNYQSAQVNFVNASYWVARALPFVEGGPFDGKESLPTAVLREQNARQYFGNESAIGKKISFQGTEYTIVGIVADFSSLTNEGTYHVWVPYKYNKGIPSGDQSYNAAVLFPAGTSAEEMKQAVKRAVDHVFETQGKEMDYQPQTLRETVMQNFASGLARYDIWLIILVLLVVPAVNILTLSIANVNVRADEIALRRALGMSRGGAFVFVLSENLLLVLVGTILGLAVAYPAAGLVGTAMLGTVLSESNSLIPQIDYGVILFNVLPLAVVFSLLSGGVSAWLLSRRNIAGTLKGTSTEVQNGGGNKWQRWRAFGWIYLEQALVFIILMLCIVAVGQKIREYNTPGMLDTEEVVNYGYMFAPEHRGDQEMQWEVRTQMETIGRELTKQSEAVVAVTQSVCMLPYTRPDENNFSDSIIIDGKKIFTMLKGSDQGGFEVLRPVLEEGEWLPSLIGYAKDEVPIVISRQLADSAGWHEAVGQKINLWGAVLEVVGVIEGMKNSVFANSYPTIIMPAELLNGMSLFYGEYAARIKPGQQAQFINDLYTIYRRTVDYSGVDLIVNDMTEWKRNSMMEITAPLIAQGIPTVFFLIFGFIGTSGLFWLYSKKRVEEFALRRAIGATKNRLVGMVITESVVLTLLAAVPGLLLAVFIYSWDSVVLLGIFATLAVMLIFSVFSAWYSAYKVSRVSPAEALHNE